MTLWLKKVWDKHSECAALKKPLKNCRQTNSFIFVVTINTGPRPTAAVVVPARPAGWLEPVRRAGAPPCADQRLQRGEGAHGSAGQGGVCAGLARRPPRVL